MFKKKNSLVTVFLIVTLAFLLPNEVAAMGFGKKMILFSEVKGLVLDHGKPVAGTEVVRYCEWAWNKKENVDRTQTDKNGRFAFPRVIGSSIAASFLPHQPVIHQNITIKVNGKPYKAWVYAKMNYDDNGELDGKAIDIVSDIATDAGFNGTFYGISTLR